MTEKKMREAFSLVELIIVIAIVALLIGFAALGLGYLRLTDAKGVASGIDSSLTALKANGMGKEGTYYMHLYSYDGNYYVSYNDQDTAYDPATDGTGKKLGPDAVSVSYDGTGLGSGDELCFAIQKKDGAFKPTSVTPSVPKEIVAEASNGSTYKVHIVELTGKHYME